MRRVSGNHGVALVQLLIAIFIMLTLTILAIPSIRATQADNRITGDAQGIAGRLALAKMKAAANFTQERLNFNLTAGTYSLEIYDRASSSFKNDEGAQGGAQYLTTGDSFGFGSIAAPAGGQATIQQSALITFNSRGIPIDSSGNPTSTYTIYLNNGSGIFYAITPSLSGRIIVYRWNGTVWQGAV